MFGLCPRHCFLPLRDACYGSPSFTHRAFTLFHKPHGKSGARAQKRRFACAVVIENFPTKIVLSCHTYFRDSRAHLAKELLRTAASFRRRPIRSVKPRKKSPCTARIQGLIRKFKQSDVLPRRAAHAIKSKMPAFCGTMKFSCTLYRLPGNLSTVFRAPRKNFTVSRSSL